MDGKLSNRSVAGGDGNARETDALLSNLDAKSDYSDRCDALLNRLDAKNDRFKGSGWLHELGHHFGFRFLAAIFIVKHVFLSSVLNLTGPPTAYIFRLYGVDAPHMQIYNTVTCFPLAVMPIISLMSDCFPWQGANKGPYMLMAAMLGAPAFLAIGLMPAELLGTTGLVLCLTLAKFQLCTCNVLSDSRYMMKIADTPSQGPTLVAFVKTGTLIFGLLGSLASGYILQGYGPSATYLVAFPLALTVFFPLSKGWLSEPVQSNADAQKVRARLHDNMAPVILAFIVCGGAVAITAAGIIFADARICSIVSVVVLAVLLVSYVKLMQAVIAKFLVYVLITNALSVSTAGAAYYFYTDTHKQFPEGPHFSPFFYTTTMHVVSITFGIIGTITYVRYLRSWTYRGLICLTIVFGTLCRLMDTLLFTGINRQWGIPDVVLVMGEEVIGPVLEAWRAMPVAILMANVCPKGMESTMNGLNASAIYIGQSAAKCFGALLLEYMDCLPGGGARESHQFENLWKVSMISTVLTTAAGVGFIWLIPQERQDVVLHTQEEDEPSKKSLNTSA